MQKTRSARAIAIAKTQDNAKLIRVRFLAMAIGATVALLSVPSTSDVVSPQPCCGKECVNE
ncbi:hypothetical protein F4695_001019 [Rhizobium soli]|uniref:Uncharacterized protein n=1 Tax=Rhizobium soli TaxID=424798 RepID=A0A7X0JIZ8_9HYPH|nr:hypothetical protein [Rhizobium soli]MBB6507687.1 hypothetical protein [Rhizobium soli]